MNRIPTGRVSHSRRVVAALPFLFLSFSTCRERIPTGPDAGLENPRFSLQLSSYYSYDNWNLDPDGFRTPSSKFRTAWRVMDTSATVSGYSDVVVVNDSTFAKDFRGNDSLVSVGNRFFRTSVEGDVFELGFIARLLEQHDTVLATAKWDKILAAGSSWIVQAGDSANGGTVYASVAPMQELVGVTVNGMASGVRARVIDITNQDPR
jgi:hypothetical protein